MLESYNEMCIRDSSKVVGKMTDKDACEIVSVKGDWAKITSGKVEGYVKTEYLLTGDVLSLIHILLE